MPSLRSAVIALALSSTAHAITSDFVRADKARDLEPHEIKGCKHQYSTPWMPGNDYFRGAGCDSQVHLSLLSPTTAVIVYASPDATTKSKVKFRELEPSAKSRFATGTRYSYTSIMNANDWNYGPPMGTPKFSEYEVGIVSNTSKWPGTGSEKFIIGGMLDYKNPAAMYSSPVIHVVELTDLTPGASYAYFVQADNERRTFKVPEAVYPFTVGLTADIGQTIVSKRSMEKLANMDADVCLISGDLSYADGWPFLWDTFGQLAADYFAEIPVLATGGNHEMANFAGAEQWQSYVARWPSPYVASESTSPLYWSIDAGPVHIVALNTYDNFVDDGDRIQRMWLEEDLKKSGDKWTIVMMHAPFYNSNAAHAMEAELMRQKYEPILLKYGVDIVLSGHVHSYERSNETGVYDNEPNACGPVYLNLGDGGNREGTHGLSWNEPQPIWSAFREMSFGVGSLEVISDTEAKYSWHRDSCGAGVDPALDWDSDDCAVPHSEGGPGHTVTDEIILSRAYRSSPACDAAKADAPVMELRALPKKHKVEPWEDEEPSKTVAVKVPVLVAVCTLAGVALGALIAAFFFKRQTPAATVDETQFLLAKV